MCIRDRSKKGKGPPAACAGIRAVVLADALAKVWHGAQRARVFPYYEQRASDTQFGGRPGKGSNLAALAIR
eukprot:10687820-Alexandrium_andersonii.AAC.1